VMLLPGKTEYLVHGRGVSRLAEGAGFPTAETDVAETRFECWVSATEIRASRAASTIRQASRCSDFMRQHPAFDRYRESYPRRSELHQNYYSRDGDEQSAVPAGV
jgi:hypothetical protein